MLMKMNLSKVFFLGFMIIGVMLCLCSNNWLFIWCGLELSLICFLPLIHSKFLISSESSMKYFLVQSISSSILILGLMMMVMEKFNYDFIILSSILIKMGVAPFHTWLLMVVEGLTMLPMMLMFTLSKIPPLVVLTLIQFSISFVISLTLVVGALFGLNQNSIRKIVTYSSIFNMGLILISIKMNFIWIYYLAVYSFLVVMMILVMYKMNMFYLNQIVMNELIFSNKIIFWFNLLSMGGMPPLLGFSIKLLVIQFTIENLMILNLILIILCSLLVMFFYLRMTYMSLMIFSVSPKHSLIKVNKFSLSLLVINVVSLPLIMTIKVFN